ncbi:DUF4258 domain-containing protein [Eisenbergiella sp.]
MILDTIQQLLKERKIKWSTHAAARIQERNISRLDVLNCLEKGEIIEDYPTDFPNPSCLVYGLAIDNRVIHVVAGCDGEMVYIITAYVPNLDKFEPDLRTRRER